VSNAPEICQSYLGVAPWMDPLAARLPGLQPVQVGEWLQRDDAFDGQMAYRDHLLRQKRDDVLAAGDTDQAERDLLAAVLADVAADPAYLRTDDIVLRPDGVSVSLSADRPLVTAARLAQEDFLLLRPVDGEYVLTSGVLCFPASWTLAQKYRRGMMAIHGPVDRYNANIGKRVDRVFAMLQPDQAVWRANLLCYNDPNLYQPRLEHERRPFDRAKPTWVRVERQTLRRLGESRTVVFSIHTWLVPLDRLSPEQAATLPEIVRNGGSMGETN
jgi:dimethylamine monooxygenase subunit A